MTGPITRVPAPIVPRPAASVGDLRGRRLIVGLPGLGWRADLRGDAPVIQGSRTYVPVLTEHEWYRAESEQVEVFAPLVPIERVWVETIGSTVDEEPPTAARSAETSAPSQRPTPAAVATSAYGWPTSSTGTGGPGPGRPSRPWRCRCTCCGSNSQPIR